MIIIGMIVIFMLWIMNSNLCELGYKLERIEKHFERKE